MIEKVQSEHIEQGSETKTEEIVNEQVEVENNTEKIAGSNTEEAIKRTAEGAPVGVAEKRTESNLESLRSELEAARAKAEENWGKVLRVQAELENQRKRSIRYLENAHKYAIDKFALELLPVKDSLELGLGHSDDQADVVKLHEGMELTLKMFCQAMAKFNIEEINPEGSPFDPELHQAMTIQENSELPPNTVITVMQKGYTLNDRLLRPAMVIVSKRPDPK